MAERKKYTLVRLGGYLLRHKVLLTCALLLTVGSNLFALIGPMLSGYAINVIEAGKGQVDFSRVFYYGAWMAGFYVVSSAMGYLLSVLMLTFSKRVIYQMRKDVFDKLLELPAGYFDIHRTGDIISRISYDIDTVNTSLSSDLIQLSTTVITVVGAFSMMVMISPRLVLVFAFTVPLSVLITKFLTGKTRPLFRERSRSIGELNGFVEEKISGFSTLKAYAREEKTVEQFKQVNKQAVEAYYRAEYYGGTVGPAVNFINNLSLSLISVFGALLYLAGQMSIGNISSFVLYSRKFSGPINETANIIGELQSTLAAAERIFALMDEPCEVLDREDARELNDVAGDVELTGVRFGYEENQPIIHDLSLRAKPGQTVAVVGPTGGGKTTLINLLMRFYDVDDGHIYVDRSEVRDVTRTSLRKSYAMVLQDTWLFQGTVFENLAYGKEDATMEEVVAAAKAAHIHGFIKRLPKGYDTVLNEDGTNISKGQKQLLTIARAMLLDARMLILDEATSNVDTRTELKIQKAMKQLMEGKTCFIIAHRLSTIREADLILVVDHGDIVEQGTHETLMEKQGFYSQLYRAQFE